jgi:hypothetical protein
VKSLLRKEKQLSDFRLANWNNERAARNPSSESCTVLAYRLACQHGNTNPHARLPNRHRTDPGHDLARTWRTRAADTCPLGNRHGQCTVLRSRELIAAVARDRSSPPSESQLVANAAMHSRRPQGVDAVEKYFSADGPTFSAPPVHLMRAEVGTTSTDQKATTGLRTCPTAACRSTEPASGNRSHRWPGTGAPQ